MQLKFTKMHGIGNDFMVVNALSQPFTLTARQIARLADRHFGVGFDQLLLIEPAQQDDVDFTYRIFNANGGEVGQCGNGARCLAKYLFDHQLTQKRQIKVATVTGQLQLAVGQDGLYEVNMGVPRFGLASDDAPFHWVDMGNPHVILTVPDITQAPVATDGALWQSHPNFPNGVNVNFMQIHQKNEISLRVFERGVGETLACGSGACASVVIGRRYHGLAPEVTVHLPGGDLIIAWQNEHDPVLLRGPAVTVFEGVITDPEILGES